MNEQPIPTQPPMQPMPTPQPYVASVDTSLPEYPGTPPHMEQRKIWPIVLILSILTVLGLGLGIFGLLTMTSKDTEINSLKSKIAKQEEWINNTANTYGIGSDDIKSDDITPSPVETGNYIYVGKWGLKLTIDKETLKKTGYVYYDSSDERIDGILGLWGVGNEVYGDFSFADFEKNKSPMVLLWRNKKGAFDSCRTECGKVVYEDTSYEYRYLWRQGTYYSIEAGLGDEVKDAEDKSMLAISSWLDNIGNFARF